MIYVACVLIMFAIVASFFIAKALYEEMAEKEVAKARNNEVMVEARHHSYVPMFVNVNVSEDKFAGYSLEAMADDIVKREASKLQNRIDRVMWWSEFLDTSFNKAAFDLKAKCTTKAATDYIDSMKPKNFSVLVVTKTCPETKQSLSKSYTAVMVQQMIDKQRVEVPKRFTVTSPKMRYETMKHDNFTCTKCGRSGLDVELHVMPVSADSKELITVCKDCYNEVLKTDQ